VPHASSPAQKVCTKCRVAKPLDAFNRARRCDDGRQYWCRECQNATWRATYAANPDRQRERHLRRRHGIGLAEYEDLLGRQAGRCAACGDALGTGFRAHVDHCHESKVIRGILCQPCNVTLGYLRDDPSRLRALAAYVERPPFQIPHQGVERSRR